jgi:hypothetical protein
MPTFLLWSQSGGAVGQEPTQAVSVVVEGWRHEVSILTFGETGEGVRRLLPAQEGLDDAHAAAAAGTRMLFRFCLFGLGVDSLDGIDRDERLCKQLADVGDILDAGLAREPTVITDTVEALRQDGGYRASSTCIARDLRCGSPSTLKVTPLSSSATRRRLEMATRWV